METRKRVGDKTYPSKVYGPVAVMNVHEEENDPGLKISLDILMNIIVSDLSFTVRVGVCTLTMIFSPTFKIRMKGQFFSSTGS